MDQYVFGKLEHHKPAVEACDLHAAIGSLVDFGKYEKKVKSKEPTFLVK